MKIKELLLEYEDTSNTDSRLNIISSVLTFLITRAKGSNLEPKLKITTLLSLLQHAGCYNITYSILEMVIKSIPSIFAMVKSITSSDIVLNLDTPEDDDQVDMDSDDMDSDDMDSDDMDSDDMDSDDMDSDDTEDNLDYMPPDDSAEVEDDFRAVKPTQQSIVKKMANDARRHH